MSPLLVVLAVVTFSLMVVGVFLFVRSIASTNPFVIPKFLLVVPVLVVLMGVVSEHDKAKAPAPASAAQPTGEVVSFVTPPPVGEKLPEPEESEDTSMSPPTSMPSDDQTEDVVAEPTPDTTERTPAQNLAIIADRDPNDPEIAGKLARLDSLCPEDSTKVGDIIVNLQQVVESKSGRTLSIPYLMDQMLTAQEVPAQTGNMKCLDTAAMLSFLLEKE